jgi:acetoacetate decarboxylase
MKGWVEIMLYALDRDLSRSLTKLHNTATFTGAEILLASFRTDPEVVADILPRPLRAPDDPTVGVFVAHYPETDFGVTYHEGAVFVSAVHRGELGCYMLAMPVDDDTALVLGRERFGYPKKMAQISLERDEGHVVGSVVRKGVEIIRLECELSGAPTPADMDLIGPVDVDLEGRPCHRVISYNFKYGFSPSGKGFDYVPRLVREAVLFAPRDDQQTGAGKLVLTSSRDDAVGDLPVRELVSVVYGTWDTRMLPGKVVGRAWNLPAFVSHALFKDDLVSYVLDAGFEALSRDERRREWKRMRRY